MSFPHNIEQTKNNFTSHMQKILNKINTRLNKSTKLAHHFNANLNKILAHASPNHLQPHKPTSFINIFIQNSNESDHMHQSHLNKKFKHDPFLFVLFQSNNTNTSTLPTTVGDCCMPPEQFCYENVHSNQNMQREKFKQSSIIDLSLIKFRLVSLFSNNTEKTNKHNFQQTFPSNNNLTMPPSPVNLPSSPISNAPVLAPLTKKKHPFRSIYTPKSATDKLFAPPTHQVPQLTSATKIHPTTIVDHVPEPEDEPPVVSIATPKQNYAESITNLPSAINYSSDALFVMCQLRRGKNDSINNELARLHNDGSAPRFLETLITASFLARPTTSTLHSQLRIRQIKFETMKNNTPTYSVSFGSLLKTTGQDPTYARHGTPSFQELQSYVHDFVFERWHTTDDLDLETYREVLSAIYFTLPPCNHPSHKPIAFLAGLPPQVFGRKTFHTQIILSHLHTLLKPLLPGSSRLHNYCYFLQAFGLQVRRNYTFKEGLQEDVYVACVSNTADHRLLANILFPSPNNEHPQLPILNLPVTFIPLPTRPPKTARVALSRYYQTITSIATTIQTQRMMLETLPFITTPIFKNPESNTTCKLILDNRNTITYAILHSIQRGISTRIYIKDRDIIKTNVDDTVRSWFNPSEHTKLFFPKATQHPPQLNRSPTMIDSIVQNLEASISLYAKAIGVQPPPTHANNKHNNNTSNAQNTTTNSSLAAPNHQQTTTTSPSITTPTIPQIPMMTHNPTSISPISINQNPPQIPIITTTDTHVMQITPRKRRAIQSPTPPSETSSVTSPNPSPTIKKEPILDITSPSDPPADPASPDTTSNSNDDSNSTTTQDLPNTYSIRVDGIATTLRHSLPSTKQPFIDDEEISEKALSVYEASNQTDAIQQAKKDLLILADSKIAEYKRMRAKKKTKVRSAKKKKKSLKETNPYLI